MPGDNQTWISKRTVKLLLKFYPRSMEKVHVSLNSSHFLSPLCVSSGRYDGLHGPWDSEAGELPHVCGLVGSGLQHLRDGGCPSAFQRLQGKGAERRGDSSHSGGRVQVWTQTLWCSHQRYHHPPSQEEGAASPRVPVSKNCHFVSLSHRTSWTNHPSRKCIQNMLLSLVWYSP